MKKIALNLLLAVTILLSSCVGREQGAATEPVSELADAITWNDYRNIEPDQIETNIIPMLRDEWMLITSGDSKNYNTMTASWGAMGNIWSRPVALITVKNTRYTFGFLQKNDIFTLSFFAEDYKPALTILGTKSGRDGDKVAEAGLTPLETPEGSMSFEQAYMIMECRKIYEDKLDPRSIFDDDIAADYLRTRNELHHLFMGEILNVWVK